MLTEVSKQTLGQKTAFDRIAEFASSDIFERMFREGMDLVEETAAYLDGDGRQEARGLERAAALAYASESMRLTTRLMQSASWLLVHRAVREGEMTPRDAHDPKYRLGARAVCSADKQPSADLPVRLLDLLERSKRLYDRVDRMEVSLFEASEKPPENPVNAQLMRLQAALGASS
ncbi:MAG: regulator of CtrA degradation rcdA [Alphaproteobacteria bacterium PA3]|nr:MAG: regulator of CtrA degradation rcdA [Alphaproteobacteria bacterium PA3]